MREVKKKSAVPLLAAGVLWLIYAAVFPLYRITDFMIISILSIGVWFLLSKLMPAKTFKVKEVKKPVSTGDKNADTMLGEGQKAVLLLQGFAVAIKDHEVRSQAALLEGRLQEIIDYLQAHPGKAGSARRFFNYYMPTTLKLLTSFQSLERKGPENGENTSATMQSIRSALSNIVTAYRNQLDALYADTRLDISTDIEVLETMMRSDGLLKKEL